MKYYSLYITFFFIFLFKISYEKLISVVSLTGYSTSFPDLERNISIQNQTETKLKGNNEYKKNGEIFKSYYTQKTFLNDKFIPTEIKFYCVDHPKIISDAIGFINGLYPKVNVIPTMQKTKPPSLLETNKINLYVNNASNDYILNPYDCLYVKKEHIKKQLKKIIDKTIFEITNNEKEIVINDYLNALNLTFTNKSTTIEEKSIYLVNYLFKNRKKLENKFHKIPKNSREKMKKMVLNELYSPFLSGDEFAQITSSAFLEQVVKIFNIARVQKFLKNNPQKLISFHSFTTNIADVIGNLFQHEKLKMIIEESINNQEEFDFLVPITGSTISFELHQDDLEDKNYFVKVLMNGKVVENNLDTEDERYLNGEIPFNHFKDLIWESITSAYHGLFCGKQYVSQQKDLLQKQN